MVAGPGELRSREPERIADYQVSALLGEGGQGAVYLGKSPDGTWVAVKVLHAHYAADPETVRRFLREAEVAASVAAFCTAKVVGTGIMGGRPYIVSEYVHGPSLDELIKTDGPRTGSGLERLAVTTLTALASIHRAGIVHRDFKPGNVILGPEGPVVIDFGIARALDHMTKNTRLVGTPAYMAPEQFTDEPVTVASDMFAWGSTMVFAATGRLAFPGSTVPAILHAILYTEPDISGVPHPLYPLVAAALAKNPASRPTADDLLRRLTGGEPARPHTARPHTGDPRPAPEEPFDRHTLFEPAPPPGPGFSADDGRGLPHPGPPATATRPVQHRRPGKRSRGPLIAAAAVVTALAVTAGVLLVPSWLDGKDAAARSDAGTLEAAASPTGSPRPQVLDLEKFPHIDADDGFADDTSKRYIAHRPHGEEALPVIAVGGRRYTATGAAPYFGMVAGPGVPSSGEIVSVLTVGTFAATGEPEDSVFVGWVKDGNGYVSAWYNNTRKKSGIEVRVDGSYLETPGDAPVTLKEGDRFALRLSGDTITSYAETGGEWRKLLTAKIGQTLTTPQARQQYRYGFGLRASNGTISIARAEGRSVQH